MPMVQHIQDICRRVAVHLVWTDRLMRACAVQHFLQRFPPGADRFGGVDHFEANNGSPALSEAIAYIECTVKSRMETNDHWITYAEVTSGGLTDADAKTAVHRRKVANYY